MRPLIVALAFAAAAGAASAQQDPSDPGIRLTDSAAPTPIGAHKQAENAVRALIFNPGEAKFRNEAAKVAATVKHYAFDEPTEGPVSIVCGQYALHLPSGGYAGYAWFFVAIKHGQVLWSDIDDANPGGPRVAYGACKGSGLAN
jgi:hypothetical protein